MFIETHLVNKSNSVRLLPNGIHARIFGSFNNNPNSNTIKFDSSSARLPPYSRKFSQAEQMKTQVGGVLQNI